MVPAIEHKIIFSGLEALFSFHEESFLPAIEKTAAAVANDVMNCNNNKEPSLTQHDRKTSSAAEPVIHQNNQAPLSLRFFIPLF